MITSIFANVQVSQLLSSLTLQHSNLLAFMDQNDTYNFYVCGKYKHKVFLLSPYLIKRYFETKHKRPINLSADPTIDIKLFQIN